MSPLSWPVTAQRPGHEGSAVAPCRSPVSMRPQNACRTMLCARACWSARVASEAQHSRASRGFLRRPKTDLFLVWSLQGELKKGTFQPGTAGCVSGRIREEEVVLPCHSETHVADALQRRGRGGSQPDPAQTSSPPAFPLVDGSQELFFS